MLAVQINSIVSRDSFFFVRRPRNFLLAKLALCTYHALYVSERWSLSAIQIPNTFGTICHYGTVTKCRSLENGITNAEDIWSQDVILDACGHINSEVNWGHWSQWNGHANAEGIWSQWSFWNGQRLLPIFNSNFIFQFFACDIKYCDTNAIDIITLEQPYECRKNLRTMIILERSAIIARFQLNFFPYPPFNVGYFA